MNKHHGRTFSRKKHEINKVNLRSARIHTPVFAPFSLESNSHKALLKL